MPKQKFKKLYRLLRIIRNKNYNGETYKFYWDILFNNDINYRMIFGDSNKTNNRVQTYKLWGV